MSAVAAASTTAAQPAVTIDPRVVAARPALTKTFHDPMDVERILQVASVMLGKNAELTPAKAVGAAASVRLKQIQEAKAAVGVVEAGADATDATQPQAEPVAPAQVATTKPEPEPVAAPSLDKAKPQAEQAEPAKPAEPAAAKSLTKSVILPKVIPDADVVGADGLTGRVRERLSYTRMLASGHPMGVVIPDDFVPAAQKWLEANGPECAGITITSESQYLKERPDYGKPFTDYAAARKPNATSDLGDVPAAEAEDEDAPSP